MYIQFLWPIRAFHPASIRQSSIFACSSRASSSSSVRRQWINEIKEWGQAAQTQHGSRRSHCHNPGLHYVPASFCLAPLINENPAGEQNPGLRQSCCHFLRTISKGCRMFTFWSSRPTTWSLLSSCLRFASSSATAYHGISMHFWEQK